MCIRDRCRHLDEQTFTSLIPALKWMASIIETYCLREIFCPILGSTRITSHFSRIEPQCIGLAKLSMKVETPEFIPPNLWPPNSPDLNPVDYKIWGILQQRVYKTSSKDVNELRHQIAEKWDKLDQRIMIKQLDSGERDFKRVWLQVEGTLNTRCNVYHLWYSVSEF